ncbi:MAG: hypothetical protein OIF50_01600 [Flavobacteriaceae bacterium]|nr:hypothetical protein [Flavobacteriaceae bacterium]
MKTIKNLCIVLCGVFALQACSSDDAPAAEDTQSYLYQKWELKKNTTSKNANTAKIDVNAIKSIEFLEIGRYILVDTSNTIYSDTYTADLSKKEIKLSNLGVLSISELTSSNFNFSIVDTNGAKSTYTANAAEKIETKINKDIIKGWSMTNINEVYGGSSQEKTVKAELLMTAYGTIFFNQYYESGKSTFDLTYWKWKNSEEKTICFRLLEEDTYNCEKQWIKIDELSKNSLQLSIKNASSANSVIYKFIPLK